MTRTYGSLRLTAENQWEVSNLESHVAIRLKQIFARIPKHQSGAFLLPNDLAHAADIEWFTARYPLAVSDADREALHGGRLAFEGNQAEMERILQPSHEMPAYVGLRPGKAVRHYQAQAVEVLMRAKGLLVGDEVGLGKTFITAAACLAPGTLPAAIVCKTHLQRQWFDVLTEFTTLRVHEIRGTRPYKLPPADVYIFRYSQIAGWVDTYREMQFKLVAFDEIQELRTGRSTAKGAAAWALCEYADFKLGLTATPIYNYGNEIWHIVEFLRPGLLGTWFEFTVEWLAGRVVKNPDALGMFLREQYAFLRRTKKDVGQEPATTVNVDTDNSNVKSIG
ncbi:SNF2-related protein [Parvibaculum sp.]|uniref:SNF2-related protein n=1 Tax=Parvibaculum sp. TaxID=2024848 RepID=UPI002732B63F|nr:SNF2-related protein [Parvibaculum sp.]MDP3328729.1 SNF2-related protein [Parvibaculum sp.]